MSRCIVLAVYVKDNRTTVSNWLYASIENINTTSKCCMYGILRRFRDKPNTAVSRNISRVANCRFLTPKCPAKSTVTIVLRHETSKTVLFELFYWKRSSNCKDHHVRIFPQRHCFMQPVTSGRPVQPTNTEYPHRPNSSLRGDLRKGQE